MKPSTMLSIVQPCLASFGVKPQGQRPATDLPIVIHEDFACPRSRVDADRGTSARRSLADPRRRKADPHEAARPPNTPGVCYAEIVRAVSPIWLQVRRTSRHGSVRPRATS